MEDESDYTSQYVPRLLNEEPVVLVGLTQAEFFACLGVGAVVGVVFCVVIAFIINLGLFFVIVFAFFAGLGTFIMAKKIRSSKVGKPRGYMGARIKVYGSKISKKLFNGSDLYLHDENLTVGRSKRYFVKR